MSLLLPHQNSYTINLRESIDSGDTFVPEEFDYELEALKDHTGINELPLLTKSLSNVYCPRAVKRIFTRRRLCVGSLTSPWRCLRKIFSALQVVLAAVVCLIVITGLFLPSYTHLPSHYQALQRRVIESDESGRANIGKEQVFIAASIYDNQGDLLNGTWADAVVELIDLLGEKNVYLSIYANYKGATNEGELFGYLKSKLNCLHTLRAETQLAYRQVPTISMPDGTHRHKRIAYLAETRNQALRPLDGRSEKIYDKLLFLNDVIFNPLEAAQLLFSTNLDEDGHANYLAACAVDFIMPFKYYDTYASRDREGYSLGVPFYPWYSNAGKAQSRRDVLNQSDAVMVKSCWGGMVAYDASFFQASNSERSRPHGSVASSNQKPIRFRAEPDLYYDASECCLVNADLTKAGRHERPDGDTGIYQNPYVRVAYDSRTLFWLGLTRRFERLYTIPHYFVNIIANMPHFNPARATREGDMVQENVWVFDPSMPGNGSFQVVHKQARVGGFCGLPIMQLMIDNHQGRGRNWEQIQIP
ncbi:hypothetical protein MMC09_002708 [Bachmanniomyces sp. S44760]|nr:hypothetical protein [Bachmanniomyces sp. S44760]